MPERSTEPLLLAGTGFFKGHGLGNDYLVFEGMGTIAGSESVADAGWPVTPATVRLVCHRHEGVGGDGIVIRLSGGGDGHRLRMFNPDGSEFERSGNGLRVFAAYLAAVGKAPAGPFEVDTGGDTVPMELIREGEGGKHDVRVSMGRARTDPRAVGAQEKAPLTDSGGAVLDWQPVSVGNPHCVVFGQEASDAEARRLGPHLETHAAFPHGVNVQVVQVVDGTADKPRIRVSVWERGVGITSASGTSACAAATACVERGDVPAGEVMVEMPGGTLRVEVTDDRSVTLQGPAREICRGALTDGFLARLEDASALRSGPESGG